MLPDEFFTNLEKHNLVKYHLEPSQIMEKHALVSEYVEAMEASTHWRDSKSVQLKLKSLEKNGKLSLEGVFANLLFFSVSNSPEDTLLQIEKVWTSENLAEMERNHYKISIGDDMEYEFALGFERELRVYKKMLVAALGLEVDSKEFQRLEEIFSRTFS